MYCVQDTFDHSISSEETHENGQRLAAAKYLQMSTLTEANAQLPPANLFYCYKNFQIKNMRQIKMRVDGQPPI